MICWNCGKEVPKGARICKHCESKVEDLPDMSPERGATMTHEEEAHLFYCTVLH